MKKNIFFTIILVLCSNMLQAQLQNSFITKSHTSQFSLQSFLKDSVTPKAMYLQKSRNQRTAGWIMVGGGAAMLVAGTVIFSSNFDLFSSKNDDAASAGGVMMLVGTGCCLGSIPLFISAAHNARKAAEISFKPQRFIIPQQNNFTTVAQPAVRITIRF